GHVRLVKRARGSKWYAKYRLPDGRQVQKLLGPAWSERGRPPGGHYTRKTAEAELRRLLTDVERGTLAGAQTRTGKSFADACAEWLRYVELEKQRAPSTLRDYRNTVECYLKPEFGKDASLEAITTERVDAFRERMLDEGKLSRRSIQKIMVLLFGIFKRAKRRKWIAANPAEDAERVTVRRSGDFNVLDPVEVEAAARATATDQNAAIVTVAAFAGLRMGELRALTWRDVDFERSTLFVRWNFTAGMRRQPKSGRVRSVPLIDQAARALDGLSRRAEFTGPDDLVFASAVGTVLDDGEMRRAFYAALERAGLGGRREGDDPFVFHDLRHTFGTLAVQAWPLHDVQGYMGHADIQTTMLYVHHQPKVTAAAELTRLVAQATSAENVSRAVSRTEENSGGASGTQPALASQG
ncbi:MAG: tyrosine-type recombinase/integrase, partial [Actinomycetota bacterium]|nr:tyrosine-type recombinase/integrase [Actinomycetota bacterium]